MTGAIAVLNPAAGGGRAGLRWAETASHLSAAGLDVEVRMTRGPGDAVDIVRAALRSGVTRVIAAGGDGTLNEVVNGFFGEDGEPLGATAELGLLPAGTGGDFRRAAGIPSGTREAVALLARGTTRRIDVGRIDFGDSSRRFFVNIADCGLGGEVVRRVNRSQHKTGGLRGSAVFLGASVATVWDFGSRLTRIGLDGAEERADVQSIVVANGRCFGGGMRIAPAACLDDGLFDVVVVGARGRVATLTGLPSLYRGRHLTREGVSLQRARTVSVEALGAALLFEVDGEEAGQTPAMLTCIPGAITLIAPPSGGAERPRSRVAC